MKWQLEQTDDEPDLTPMIDIVFLLIVFFMTVASVVTQKRVEIDAPIASNAQVAESQENREVVSLRPEGELFFAGAEVTLEQFQGAIAERLAANPNLQVLLRIDTATPYIHTRDLMSACSEVGAVNIIFTSYQSDK